LKTATSKKICDFFQEKRYNHPAVGKEGDRGERTPSGDWGGGSLGLSQKKDHGSPRKISDSGSTENQPKKSDQKLGANEEFGATKGGGIPSSRERSLKGKGSPQPY